MHSFMSPDGNITEHYENPFEYKTRGNELQRTGGRKQIIYEGWLNGELVRIMRR